MTIGLNIMIKERKEQYSMLQPPTLRRWCMGGGSTESLMKTRLFNRGWKDIIARSALRVEINHGSNSAPTAVQRWIWSDNDGDDFCSYGRKKNVD